MLIVGRGQGGHRGARATCSAWGAGKMLIKSQKPKSPHPGQHQSQKPKSPHPGQHLPPAHPHTLKLVDRERHLAARGVGAANGCADQGQSAADQEHAFRQHWATASAGQGASQLKRMHRDVHARGRAKTRRESAGGGRATRRRQKLARAMEKDQQLEAQGEGAATTGAGVGRAGGEGEEGQRRPQRRRRP